MPLGSMDIVVDLSLPASEASTQSAVDSIRSFVNGLETSGATAAARGDAVRGAMLTLLTEAQALLPAIFERLKPMADTAPLMTALDEAIAAIEAS